jgi:hypothetical protein
VPRIILIMLTFFSLIPSASAQVWREFPERYDMLRISRGNPSQWVSCAIGTHPNALIGSIVIYERPLRRGAESVVTFRFNERVVAGYFVMGVDYPVMTAMEKTLGRRDFIFARQQPIPGLTLELREARNHFEREMREGRARPCEPSRES